MRPSNYFALFFRLSFRTRDGYTERVGRHNCGGPSSPVSVPVSVRKELLVFSLPDRLAASFQLLTLLRRNPYEPKR